MSIRASAAGAGLVAAVAVAMGSLAVPIGQSRPAVGQGDFGGLNWRSLGPFRGGATTAVAGLPSDPRVIVIGTAGGGIWKSSDYGRAWRPVFDNQSIGVIGALAAAPSDPQVLYAGTGTTLEESDPPHGNGLYKSTDGGETWTHLGLAESGRIPQIAVHPTDSNQILIAVLGEVAGPGPERGVFRSINGGRTFDKVLFRGEDTGALDVVFDPRQPSIAYATLWQAARTSETSDVRGPGGGIFKSADGGATWQPVGGGLPTAVADGLSRATLAISPARAGRVFANVTARARGGLYRSDDEGATWALVTGDRRLNGADVDLDPVNPDVIYAAGAGAYRSTDGGRTWTAWRAGSAEVPYHKVWIHPVQSGVAVLASARGALVTVNGGQTWSSGFGQPTSAFSQVTADAAFPYRVCGGRSAGGIQCVPSGGGQTPAMEWRASDLSRPGYVVVDPADPDLLYGAELRRYDRRTGQILDVSPPGQPASSPAAAAPLLFSPTNQRTLYYASTALWASTSGGQTWTTISPEFVSDRASASAARPVGPGTISALSASSIDGRVIWIGTDAGRFHVTRDQGATWRDVTPAGLAAPAVVVRVEASHFDTSTAYAVVRLDRAPRRSRVLRTRDGGTSWTDIGEGMGAGAIHVVREDAARRGLLFAAGDDSVLLSFDDGDSWRSLRLNLPPVPIRDLVAKDADLIAATAGRGFWVLDDLSPLRQLTPDILQASAFLFRPATAWRARAEVVDVALDSTAGVAEPAPEGVAITYALGADADEPLTLEITEGPAGEIVRRYSSEDAGSALRRTAGLHRVRWDLRHTPPAADWLADTPVATAPLRGRWVLPGTYQVRLTTGRGTLRQAVAVRMDPRVRTSTADLTLQSKLTRTIEDSLAELAAAYRAVRGRPSVLPTSPISTASSEILAHLREAGRQVAQVLVTVQQADARPTAATETAVGEALARARAAIDQAK